MKNDLQLQRPSPGERTALTGQQGAQASDELDAHGKRKLPPLPTGSRFKAVGTMVLAMKRFQGAQVGAYTACVLLDVLPPPRTSSMFCSRSDVKECNPRTFIHWYLCRSLAKPDGDLWQAVLQRGRLCVVNWHSGEQSMLSLWPLLWRA
jgi:hypothetical protein